MKTVVRFRRIIYLCFTITITITNSMLMFRWISIIIIINIYHKSNYELKVVLSLHLNNNYNQNVSLIIRSRCAEYSASVMTSASLAAFNRSSLSDMLRNGAATPSAGACAAHALIL